MTVFYFFDENRVVHGVLKTYEEASGQAINFTKSGIFFSKNITLEFQVGISFILGGGLSAEYRKVLGFAIDGW